MHELDGREVHRRLESYPSSATTDATTDEVLRIGELMLQENLSRAQSVDAKAMQIIGYVGVIYTIILSQRNWFEEFDRLELFFLGAAIVCTFVATVAAMASMWARSWRSFSDEEWFRKELLEEPEALRRFHVATMHKVVSENRALHHRKGSSLVVAQGGLAAAVALFAVVLIFQAIYADPPAGEGDRPSEQGAGRRA